MFAGGKLGNRVRAALPVREVTMSGRKVIDTVLGSRASPGVVSCSTTKGVLMRRRVAVKGAKCPVTLSLSSSKGILTISCLCAGKARIRDEVKCCGFSTTNGRGTSGGIATSACRSVLVNRVFFVKGSESITIKSGKFRVCAKGSTPGRVGRIGIGRRVGDIFRSSSCFKFILLGRRGSKCRLEVCGQSKSAIFDGRVRKSCDRMGVSKSGVVLCSKDGYYVCAAAKVLGFGKSLKTSTRRVFSTFNLGECCIVDSGRLQVICLAG